MKKFTKYMSLGVLAAGVLSGLTACDNAKDNDYFSMAPTANVPVYFRVQQPMTIDLGESDTEYTYNIYRNSLSAPSTVALTWSGDTQYFFDLPSSVTFEDDALMAEITFGVNPSQMNAKDPYTLTVTLPDYESTTVTSNYIENIFRYLPFSDWEPFGYNEALGRDGLGAYNFANYYTGTEYPVYVEYRYSLVDEDEVQYRFQWLIDYTNPGLGWETFLTATSSDGGQTIRVPEQLFAYNDNYGNVYVSDMYYYTDDPSFNDSYFDEVSGTFYLDVIAYVSEGYFGYGYETCVMNGYLDTKDYSVSLSDLGSTNISGIVYEIVRMTWTANVDLVQYTAVSTASLEEDGEVSEELVEALAKNIASGKVSSTTAETQGLYSLSFADSGDYTLVAVTFKEEANGKFSMKSYGYVSFEYDSGDPNAGWTSLGYLEYTDGYMTSGYLIEPVTYYVEVQESEEYEELYRLVDPYGAPFPWNEPGDWNPNVHSYLYFDAYNPDCVYIDVSEQTLDWSGRGYLICFSLAGNELYGGASYDDIIDLGYAGTLDNGKLTFPFSTLMMSIDSGANWAYANLAYDIELYDQTGELDYLLGSDGQPVAPFMIDFNTLTDDPLAAAATRSAFKKAPVMNFSNAQTVQMPKRNAKVVKHKATQLNNGIRKAPKNFILRNNIVR